MCAKIPLVNDVCKCACAHRTQNPPNFRKTPTGERFGSSTYDLTSNRSTYMMDLQWNRVSNQEPSGPAAETLPLGHRGPFKKEGFQIIDTNLLQLLVILNK
ncbi:hypothetical protein AVEN_66634-1 [Araneus ventricosus]|uniref:Uncharacterized protein n=1 Tax=Araneus ventricosus TaxID=182803 RepID=A0A4Y2Q9M3_ARAVE|nr:hypothetical protein AVEN_66634-1 [Araneus ventricosus]